MAQLEPPMAGWRSVWLPLLWTLVGMVVLDGAIQLAFRYPTDPLQPPGTLQRYFDYGTPSETKLRRLLGDATAHEAPIAKAGWLDETCGRDVPPQPGKTVLASYGMSFSNQLVAALEALDPSYAASNFAGPAAGPNHSHACFRRQWQAAQQGQVVDASSVQLFTVLASSVKRMRSMTGATVGFENPAPYTYPVYALDASGGLMAEELPIHQADDWRQALQDPARRAVLRETLARHDRFYSPWQFDAGLADHSAYLKLINRALSQRRARAAESEIHRGGGFVPDTPVHQTLRALLTDFADKSRAAGKLPLVVLVEDGQYGDALLRWLGPTLRAHGVAHFDTHALAPTSDPRHFVADGHFTPAANARLAAGLRDCLVRAIGAAAGAPGDRAAEAACVTPAPG